MMRQMTKAVQQRASYDAVSEKYAVKLNDHVKSLAAHSDEVSAQFIPDVRELITQHDEYADPTGDEAHSPVKGIVHRYPDRVLLKLTPICPVYCRYCFRKTMVGPQGNMLKNDEIAAALDYIRRDTNIWEVILTGGDPFVLSPRRLKAVLQQIDAIDHVKIVRFHTRCVASQPEVFSQDMLQSIQGRAMRYVVMHINHAHELTDAVVKAISDIRASGVGILSQSVLLRGVNDNAAALERLFRDLVSCGVKPYMLHHLDRSPGTQHFRVSIEQGQKIMLDLRGRVSGLCLPEYMLDIPGGYGKVPLTPQYCVHKAGQSYQIQDYQSGKHLYDDRD